MNTYTSPPLHAREFRAAVKGALARRDHHHERTVSWLARRVSKSRNAVSRAVNRGEFRDVQESIKRVLDL